jgi:hypothetical protein
MSKNNIKKKPPIQKKKVSTKTITMGQSSVHKLEFLRAFRGCKTQMKEDDLIISIKDSIPFKNTIVYIYYIFRGYANYAVKS